MPEQAKDHFDVDLAFIAHLNGECLDWAAMDSEALQSALQAQGAEWYGLVQERCPHLFAAAPVFISELQLQQMRAVIAAVEEVVNQPPPQPSPNGRGSDYVDAPRVEYFRHQTRRLNPLPLGEGRVGEHLLKQQAAKPHAHCAATKTPHPAATALCV